MRPQESLVPTQIVVLPLADGKKRMVVAIDAWASDLVKDLATAMQLSASSIEDAVDCCGVVTVAGGMEASSRNGRVAAATDQMSQMSVWLRPRWRERPLNPEDAGMIPLDVFGTDAARAVAMMHLSALIALTTEREGGLLIHGALAEREGWGVVLAGPGGIGKTTASRRLPAPWRSRSDDATLIVRDEAGVYWAHPWPTWSRFLGDDEGGTWDVQRAVRLRALFFLARGESGRVDPVGSGQAAALLMQSTEQVVGPAQWGMVRDDLRALRLRRFENVTALVGAIPCHILHLSLETPFWDTVDVVLDEAGSP